MVTSRSGVVMVTLVLAACSGQFAYAPPAPVVPTVNSVVINRPRDEVWKGVVPHLAQSFFVINNLDLASGLMNVSYSGDPERFVDCGRITSHVSNLAGPRTYDFPAARASQAYEVMQNDKLYRIERTLSLDGRTNIVFEEVNSTTTRVTVNVRYVLTKQSHVQQAGTGTPQDFAETISFNSGQSDVFRRSQITTCRPTGELERQVLDLIK